MRSQVSIALALSLSLATPARAEQDSPAAEPPAAVAACPWDARTMAAGTSLTCMCAASQTMSGGVWGEGPYTADSVICRAALHAGAIRRQGGQVTIRLIPGRDRYRSRERNGVTSEAWGAFATSYEFVR